MNAERNLFDEGPKVVPPLATIYPRPYQITDHDECFRLWDSGVIGTLTRSATGTGKTIMAAMKAWTWINRGDNYRVLVVSYEKQLVWQFAQELEDVLGIEIGIEMEKESIAPAKMPKVVVASRQTLAPKTRPSPEQLAELGERKVPVEWLGACSAQMATTLLRHLRKGCDPGDIQAHLYEMNAKPEAKDGIYSRVHKFDPCKYNWLVFFDEAHRHAYFLATVKYVVDWFDRNQMNRRNGMTATPKRGDNVSIGDKMFPSVALDYPLFKINQACAVRDGFAVPYVQKYIAVEGVDFKGLKRLSGGDFDEADLEAKLGQEEVLAKLIEPLLEMCKDRRTLIFSPGVAMAQNVARYINSRAEVQCPACGEKRWYGVQLLGDGATCDCGQALSRGDAVKLPDQARAMWGEIHPRERVETYRAHQDGQFQFLSVCGLCREGYNDPGIGCVAIFRLVSKKASSLAEQMKGRACRPLRGCIDGLVTAEQRLEAIRNSSKPNALIVDLTGVTGLADCASTVQIYAEGLPDEVVERAEELLEEQGLEDGDEVDVEGAIQAATEELAAERERIRLEREAAEKAAKSEYERLAKAEARVKYTAHDVGHGAEQASQYETSDDPNAATPKQLGKIAFIGMQFENILLTKRQCMRIIGQLLGGMSFDEVAYKNGINAECWKINPPTFKQQQEMMRQGIGNRERFKTKREASLAISAKKSPSKLVMELTADIRNAGSDDELTFVARAAGKVLDLLPPGRAKEVTDAGAKRRAELQCAGGF